MDNYVKIKKIGEGSFGKALLAKRKTDGKQCVIKEICISKMSSKEREESKKEVKVLSQLKHPNIVTYLESFQGDGNLYIIMDYCDGGDLYKYIVSQRGMHIDEEKVLDIFVQCCLAIKHIHDRKILHRDIKTQNIFLTKHHIVKLGDFGIARVLKNTMELARTCIGTPYYLSPEIVENRPYNNKSDVWSLGCVLYELATLKHAFEAGNMKNLVLKIVRGSYPPIPPRYSYELRSLVAQCFKRSPSERPSINTVLKKPIIQRRIAKFLSPEKMEEEFSHTILHKERFNMAAPVLKPRPISAPVNRQPAQNKRPVGPAAIYGVSVAKKPARRPVSAVNNAGQQRRVSDQKRAQNSLEQRKKEINARERRRKDVLSQEQQYQDYMKKIQKQRYDKQQATHINRAREMGWKNVLGSDEISKNESEKKKSSPVILFTIPCTTVAFHRNATKDVDDKIDDKVQNNPMKKYQANQPNEEQVAKKDPMQQKHIEEKPMNNPKDAWNVKKEEPKPNLENAANASERARVLDEFWLRKKEALANKERGRHEVFGGAVSKPEENPMLQFHNEQMAKHARNRNEKPPLYPGARNKREMDYLKQLEAIRRQNYVERKAVQGGGHLYQPKANEQQQQKVGDPRHDPDARKKKIDDLKKQAEERSEILKKQLELRKKQVANRLENERKQRLAKQKANIVNVDERPLSQRREQKKVIESVVVPSVGMETAMNQVGRPKLFRSCSEGDLKELVKPAVSKVDRKNWGAIPISPLALANMPLEITSSAMEATAINSEPTHGIVPTNIAASEEKQQDDNRKHWQADGKTQFISMLHNIELSETQMPTMTMRGETYKVNQPTSIDQSKPSNGHSGGNTITISPKVPNTKPGETVVIPAEKSYLRSISKPGDGLNQFKDQEPGPVQIQGTVTSNKDVGSDDGKIDSPVDEMQTTPKAKSAWGKEENTAPDSNKKSSENKDDADDDSFYTPNRTLGLRTGCYDTELKEKGTSQDVDVENQALRTCSLPDLRNAGVSSTPSSPEYDGDKSPQNESKPPQNPETLPDEKASSKELQVEDLDNISDEKVDNECESNLDESNEDNDDDQDCDDADDEQDEEDECEDDDDAEELEEFESMLESMRGVLKSTAHSPLSTSVKDKENLPELVENPTSNNENVDEEPLDDEDQWGDEDDVEENNKNENDQTKPANGVVKTLKEKEAYLKDTLFSRIEESRKMLEDELGLDLFLKAYRYVQRVQDDEDDECEVGTAEITDLLGDKEHLYQKILYLVMADSAYCEGNDGLS